MRSRFTCLDIMCVVKELQPLLGLRVNQIYDINSRTYLIKLDKKIVILIESGIRIHTTQYDWPKNMAPSGFSMKLRKHLNNKRIIHLRQLGFDRIIDIQFGSGEAAYHLILEMFNKGNLILTDHQMTIISLLIPHSEGETRFAVREKYPTDRASGKKIMSIDELKEIINVGKPEEMLKKALLFHVGCGIPFIEHVLLCTGVNVNRRVCEALSDDQLNNIVTVFNESLQNLEDLDQTMKGYIISQEETDAEGKMFKRYEDFCPLLFKQFDNKSFQIFDSFTSAIDEYFSQLEYQKQEMKTIENEKEAFRKVDKIKDNQASRLEELKNRQIENKQKAELIMSNADLVEEAIRIIRLSIASQMSWNDINRRLQEAKSEGDPIAKCISKLKLQINTISMILQDKYAASDDDVPSPLEVDIDLNLSAHVNAKNYFNTKKMAARKEQKTLDSQNKAIKSAEKKARETVKDIKTQALISKSRKVLWFEKFYWCISSENYLIIGGKDQKQNEMIVKKYMRPEDIYVHADIHGASSILIKNPNGGTVPPKTLNEAGLMAVSYSIGWESKVLCNAWWVYGHQVSKTPPTGEYLPTGSFMIRGQKNYLLPAQLQLGFSYLFRIEESSLFRHIDERRVKITEELSSGNASPELPEVSHEEEELVLSNEENDDQDHELLHKDDQDQDECDNDKEFPDTDLHLHFDVKCGSPDDQDHSEDVEQSSRIQRESKQRHDRKISVESNEKKMDSQPKLKRGQKGRQKKIKEKYKDQDEEDKELRMTILKSAGAPNDGKKSKKKEAKENQSKNVTKKKGNSTVKANPAPQMVFSTSNEAEEVLEEDEEENKCEVSKEDVDLVNFLTGQPHPEDEILYAIPLVAPYSSILNYKYKVKLIPGTAKRGKAARSAAEYFIRLKECTVREKDLIKSVKDDSLFRNLPGKVKVVIPQSKKK